MTLEEIKQAVLDGKTVHWTNENYVVSKGNVLWQVSHKSSGFFVALTWSDGRTLNGKEEDFYVAVTAEERLRNVMVEVGGDAEHLANAFGGKEGGLSIALQLLKLSERLVDEANK